MNQPGSSWHGQGPRLAFPSVTPAVKWLLIANIGIFLFEALSGQMEAGNRNFFEEWGAVAPLPPNAWLQAAQVWRLVTYQFLHANLGHIAFNMLGLFFFGPRLESWWGTRRFTVYYLCCGAAGGLLYTATVLLNLLPAGVLVGASGAILAVLAACAILFPGDVVFVVFLPLPIRLAALLLAGVFILYTFAGRNAGGNVAHLGGMAAGAACVWLGPRFGSLITARRRSAWDRKMEKQRRLQLEVDRILDKVHEKGLASLSRSEKKLLQEATKLEQERQHTRHDW
jgi:membrane associated rhomboid family serine protease